MRARRGVLRTVRGRAVWGPAGLGVWLVGSAAAACSVGADDVTFIPDSEYYMAAGGTGARGGASGVSGSSGAGASTNPGRDTCDANADGTARCVGSELQICTGGYYTTLSRCAEPGRCNAARKTCLDCVPGTFRCTSGSLEQCDLEGTAFELVRTCGDQACVAKADEGYCVVCTPGASECEAAERRYLAASDDGTMVTDARNSLRVCNQQGSGTEAVEECDSLRPVCDVQEQRCRICTPGEFVCVGSELQRCADDRETWELVEDCGRASLCDAASGACAPEGCVGADGERSPVGTASCRGVTSSALSLCTPAGRWEVLELCTDAAACDAGLGTRRCLDRANGYCVPGTAMCQGTQELLRCPELAAADTPGPTGGSFYVHATCATRCVEDGVSATCEDDGSGELFSDALVCVPGEREFLDCSSTPCTASTCSGEELCAGSQWGCRSCVPNEYRCEDGVLLQCDAEGAREALVDDCDGMICDRFRGACLPALPGDWYCDGRDLRRRAADGTMQTVKTCASESLCTAHGGCLAPSCAVGSRICRGERGDRVHECEQGDGYVASDTGCPSGDRCEDGLGCVSAARVAAGEAHTCALLVADEGRASDAGLVKCWGANESGQLGNGSLVLGDEPEARAVVTRLQTGVDVAAPRFRTTGLCAGKNFTCADVELEQGVGVACWGANDKGQIGIGGVASEEEAASAFNAIRTPVTNGTDLAPRDGIADPFLGLSSVTCGAEFACALDEAQRAWCWGANEVGQLGVGKANAGAARLAQPVALGPEVVLTRIEAGARHACALDTRNNLWCWGAGEHGQLGNRKAASLFAPARFELEVFSLLLGRDFTVVQPIEDAPVSFGHNFFGQLANSTNTASLRPVPAVALTADTQLASAGPMAAHACGFQGGTLVCWGANPLGQLGDDTRDDRYAPKAVRRDEVRWAGVAGTVAVGKGHTCAIDSRGGLWCWGGNQRKQLGDAVMEPWAALPQPALMGARPRH